MYINLAEGMTRWYYWYTNQRTTLEPSYKSQKRENRYLVHSFPDLILNVVIQVLKKKCSLIVKYDYKFIYTHIVFNYLKNVYKQKSYMQVMTLDN